MKYLHQYSGLQKVEVRDGCCLRPLRSEDAANILEVIDKDPSIRQRVTVAERMRDPDDVAREVEAYQKDSEGLIRYTVVCDEKCVGLVSFWKDQGYFGQDFEPDSYGFGYFIDPDLRGKGLITDAVRALMTKSQDVLEVHRFLAFCEDDNLASRKVLLKLGFEATDRTFFEPKNGWIERMYLKKFV